LSKAQVLFTQVLEGKVVPQTLDHLRERRVVLGKATYQGAFAHPKFCCNDFGSRISTGKQLSQSPLEPVNNLGLLLWPTAEEILRMTAQYSQKPVISRNDGGSKHLSAESHLLMPLAEFHRASEESGDFFTALPALVNEMNGKRKNSPAREISAECQKQSMPELSCLTVF
jgi:hypothetical protein